MPIQAGPQFGEVGIYTAVHLDHAPLQLAEVDLIR